MRLQDLRNLDVRNIGGWPTALKAIVILALSAAILGAGYWLDTRKQIEALDKIKGTEETKRKEFEQKQVKAANLEPLRAQLEEMKLSFGAMLRQLPNQAEMEGLLVDISQTGLASGLEFELFEPQPEVRKEFYAEKPIKLRVTGRYHEFGEFVSGVAALPRIVTQHEISIKPKGGEDRRLVMEATAKTYRYLDEEAEPKAKPVEKGKGKGKAKKPAAKPKKG